MKKHLLERGLDNYDITAIVTYKKDIKEIYFDDDFEFKPDAYYLYHFKNNHWVFDKAEKMVLNSFKRLI